MIDSVIIYGLPAGLLAVVITGGIAFYQSSKQYDRLMTECQDDGHVEYECFALLKDCGSTMVPIVVPVQR